MKKKNRIATVYTYLTFAMAGVFIGFKISGIIGWSWWWVTAPIWINLLLAVGLVVWAKLYFKKWGS